LDQIFGQVYWIRIGPDYTMKILDWVGIAKIFNLFNTAVSGPCHLYYGGFPRGGAISPRF